MAALAAAAAAAAAADGALSEDDVSTDTDDETMAAVARRRAARKRASGRVSRKQQPQAKQAKVGRGRGRQQQIIEQLEAEDEDGEAAASDRQVSKAPTCLLPPVFLPQYCFFTEATLVPKLTLTYYERGKMLLCCRLW